MASRMIPSPDWFVGLDSLDLCRGGDWLDQLTVDFDPLDAGTDRGLTFTAPNWVQDPYKTISRINSTFPDHPACSFYYPDIAKLPVIARVIIVKQAWYESVGKETVSQRLVTDADQTVTSPNAGRRRTSTPSSKGKRRKERKQRTRNMPRERQSNGKPVLMLSLLVYFYVCNNLFYYYFS